VRGQGFLMGIEFADKAAPIHKALLEQRVITGTSSDPKVLRLLPPLCIRPSEIDLFIDGLKTVIANPDSQGEA
nr:aminotransferase class III-fold pyridoxal phosphate-dependent enzyme [Pyrinomonadaceae bacterium]